MASNNSDNPAGQGRGRPKHVSDLCPPFGDTGRSVYTSTEGTNDNVCLKVSPGAANYQDPDMIEAGIYAPQSGGHYHPSDLSPLYNDNWRYRSVLGPTQGINNNMFLNVSPPAVNYQDTNMIEAGIYAAQSGDHKHISDPRRLHDDMCSSVDALAQGMKNLPMSVSPVIYYRDPDIIVAEIHAGQSGEHVSEAQNDASNPAKKFELSPLAAEFIPRNFRSEPRTISPNTTIYSSPDSYPIQELRRFFDDITINPGNFESKVQSLIDCLNKHVDEDETMRAVVNIIFDESVKQPNFRYNGARLCKYLSGDLSDPLDRSKFKKLLLSKCTQEQKRRDFLVKHDSGTYLRGFVMYLAELFSQLEVSNRKIKLLGEHLITVMETLLCHQSSENVKCICQCLKLVGVHLEDLEKNEISDNGTVPQIDQIFALLKDALKNKDVRGMVNSVIELRSTDWGRGVENNDPVVEEHISHPLNEPVMYGPDGRQITAEESLFLHSQYSNIASDPEEYEPDNEMDEEIAAAYEVFLKMAK